MEQDILLTTMSAAQLGVFAGLAFLVYGWIDKKPVIADIGQAIFIVLGIYALWVIATGRIILPEQAVEITKEARIALLLKGTMVSAGIAICSLILKLLKIKYHKPATVILMVFSLLLFVLIYNIQKM